MSQMSVNEKLLLAQQEAITSFVEELEQKISTNFFLVQSLKEQSGTTSKLQEQVNAITEKEKKQNAKELCALEQIQAETTAVAEALLFSQLCLCHCTNIVPAVVNGFEEDGLVFTKSVTTIGRR